MNVPVTTTRLLLLPGKGIYCKDDAGVSWTTWSGPEQTCMECGASIQRGYVRFQNRVPDRYLCPEHVTLEGLVTV